MTYKEITGKWNQSIVDIAVLEYGSVEGIPYIIEDNPDHNFLPFPARPITNLTILIRNDAVINKKVKDHLNLNFPNIGTYFNFLIASNEGEYAEPIENFNGQVKITEYE